MVCYKEFHWFEFSCAANEMDQDEQPGRLRFDSFELDLETGELSKNGRRLRLQDQPARLLVLLVRRAGKLVTRAEIREELWGEDQFVEFDHAINTAVKKVRTVLDDDPEQPRLLETLPRKGYRFIGSVEHASPNALPDTGPSADPVASEQTNDPPGVVADSRSLGALHAPMGSGEAETALLSAGVSRVLFIVIQVGYLALYCSTLYYFERLGEIFSGFFDVTVPNQILSLIVVTAMCGIAVRLYLVSSVGLGHPSAGRQFQRLFPVVFLLDSFWAASPLLAGLSIGIGLALAATAGLAYLPFSQRTLIRNIYSIPR